MSLFDTVAEEAAVEEENVSPEEEVVEEAPKKKRRSKKAEEAAEKPEGEETVDEEPKPKKKRQPKLDEDGNPIPKRSYTILPSQTLHKTEKAAEVAYREGTKRRNYFDAIEDGMTVEAYQEKIGKEWRSFLVWYVEEAGVVELRGDEGGEETT